MSLSVTNFSNIYTIYINQYYVMRVSILHFAHGSDFVQRPSVKLEKIERVVVTVLMFEAFEEYQYHRYVIMCSGKTTQFQLWSLQTDKM